jgi:hypothetical protein
MTNESKFPWWGWLMVLFLVPVLYVLSVFPVAWGFEQFSKHPPEWLSMFYHPMFRAMEEWKWFESLVMRIVEWMGLT